MRTPAHLPEGEGLGASRPDSINVGRIAPIPSMFVPRDLEGPDELLCSTGVSLFTGLGVSATVGFGIGALSTSGSRVFVDCKPDRAFNPSAARAPASRISSSVSFAGADFFSRDLGLCGVGVGDSEVDCSDDCGVCVGSSVFFSRATITSCACIFPTRMTLQSTAGKNRFSMMPPDKRFSPFTSPRSPDVAEFNQAGAAAPESPATESAAAIRFPGKSLRDACHTVETARRQNNAHSLRGLPFL
jgi:hypothetical protein